MKKTKKFLSKLFPKGNAKELLKLINYPYKTVSFRGNEIITFAGLNLK